ncbi:MAG: response regulator transcription factor [Candidatus Melainabacteria bacterium]|nr:MAG: response regulator transcription factor [Candidatus Melainabacteria bacterium]
MTMCVKQAGMMSRIGVLIVEDHQVTLEGLTSGLSRESDIDVLGTATTSDQGLEMAAALNPQIILLDLHLPGSTGPRTTVNSFCSVTGANVIIFSGENRMAFIQTVLSMGVAGYLLKSENVGTVADAMRQVMNGKKPVLSSELVSGETKVTRSEQEVLKMLARGMKYSEIAERRQASPATVRKQCELLLLKLGLESREQLIAWAVQSGYGNLELEP